MSDGKHIEICDKETHQKLDRLPNDYTPCPTCGAKPVWGTVTLIGGDKWSVIDRWERDLSVSVSDCYTHVGIDPAGGQSWTSSYIIDSVKHIRGNIKINLSLPEYNPCDFPRPKLSRPQGDFNGVPYFVNQYLCEVKHVRFRRNHRKTRINKKWHKKYGAITRCVANPKEIKGMGFFMCPCRERELKEAIKNPTLPTV